MDKSHTADFISGTAISDAFTRSNLASPSLWLAYCSTRFLHSVRLGASNEAIHAYDARDDVVLKQKTCLPGKYTALGDLIYVVYRNFYKIVPFHWLWWT